MSHSCHHNEKPILVTGHFNDRSFFLQYNSLDFLFLCLTHTPLVPLLYNRISFMTNPRIGLGSFYHDDLTINTVLIGQPIRIHYLVQLSTELFWGQKIKKPKMIFVLWQFLLRHFIQMDYDDELRLSCEKTGDPLNKRFSKARLGSNWVSLGWVW